MIAIIVQREATDYSENVAHRETCKSKPKGGMTVDLILEPGANFLTVADSSPFGGRLIHLVPCPVCIGPLDEPVDPNNLDLGTKPTVKAGPFV